MDNCVGFGDKHLTFGGLAVSDFASRVVSVEITEGDGVLDCNGYDQDSYSRNVASISGEILVDPSDLAGSGNPDIGYDKPNFRDRSALFSTSSFSSLAILKLEDIFKTVANSTLVKLHLVSLGDVVHIICNGKIGSGQHFQVCVASVAPGLLTCEVRSHSTKAKCFNESTIYIKIPLVRGKVAVYLSPVLKVSSASSIIVHSLLQLERTVSF